MQRLKDNQCRHCGHVHEEAFHMVDAESRWAMNTVQCDCGHHWTIIYTAPGNLGALRAWLSRGCSPEAGPHLGYSVGSWHPYRLEGVAPAVVSVAS